MEGYTLSKSSKPSSSSLSTPSGQSAPALAPFPFKLDQDVFFNKVARRLPSHGPHVDPDGRDSLFPHDGVHVGALQGTPQDPLPGHFATVEQPSVAHPQHDDNKRKNPQPKQLVAFENAIRINPPPVKHTGVIEQSINDLDDHLQRILQFYAGDSQEQQVLILEAMLVQLRDGPICQVERKKGHLSGIKSVTCLLCPPVPEAAFEGSNALRKFTEHFIPQHLGITKAFVCYEPSCRKSYSHCQSRDRHEQADHLAFRPKAYEWLRKQTLALASGVSPAVTEETYAPTPATSSIFSPSPAPRTIPLPFVQGMTDFLVPPTLRGKAPKPPRDARNAARPYPSHTMRHSNSSEELSQSRRSAVHLPDQASRESFTAPTTTPAGVFTFLCHRDYAQPQATNVQLGPQERERCNTLYRKAPIPPRDAHKDGHLYPSHSIRHPTSSEALNNKKMQSTPSQPQMMPGSFTAPSTTPAGAYTPRGPQHYAQPQYMATESSSHTQFFPQPLAAHRRYPLDGPDYSSSTGQGYRQTGVALNPGNNFHQALAHPGFFLGSTSYPNLPVFGHEQTPIYSRNSVQTTYQDNADIIPGGYAPSPSYPPSSTSFLPAHSEGVPITEQDWFIRSLHPQPFSIDPRLTQYQDPDGTFRTRMT